MNLNVFGSLEQHLKKVQEQSAGLINHLDETFEVQGKKTEAQIAMEQWNAEMAALREMHSNDDLMDDEYLLGGMPPELPPPPKDEEDELVLPPPPPPPPEPAFSLDRLGLEEEEPEEARPVVAAPAWSDMEWQSDRSLNKAAPAAHSSSPLSATPERRDSPARSASPPRVEVEANHFDKKQQEDKSSPIEKPAPFVGERGSPAMGSNGSASTSKAGGSTSKAVDKLGFGLAEPSAEAMAAAAQALRGVGKRTATKKSPEIRPQAAREEATLHRKGGSMLGGSGVEGDEQASVHDKVIHMQREKMKELQREKERAEKLAREAQESARRREEAYETTLRSRSAAPPPRVPSKMEEELMRRVRTPRGMAVVGAILFVMIMLTFRTQSSMEGRQFSEVTDVGDGSSSSAADILIERNQLEQLVAELLRDKALLLKEKREGNNTSTEASEAMQRHIKSVQKVLMSMHKQHLRSRDAQHAQLSRQNDELERELHNLKNHISGQLNGTSTSAAPLAPLPGAPPPLAAAPVPAAALPSLPGTAPLPAAAPPPLPAAAPLPAVGAALPPLPGVALPAPPAVPAAGETLPTTLSAVNATAAAQNSTTAALAAPAVGAAVPDALRAANSTAAAQFSSTPAPAPASSWWSWFG